MILLAFSVGIISYLELKESRDDLLSIANSESKNLISALKYSIENNFLANEFIYNEILNSLVASASLADHTNDHTKFNTKSVNEFANTYELDLLIIQDGKQIISNLSDFNSNLLDKNLKESITEVIQSNLFWQELGIHIIGDKSYYMIAGYFTNPKTLVVVGLNEEKLLNLRKNIGIGKLINNFGTNPEIKFIALQDSIGIIAASKDIQPISTITKDTFLLDSYSHNHSIHRITEYNQTKVLESAIKIQNGNEDMILRLGISLEKVRQINQRNTTRTIFLGIGLLIIIAGTTVFVYQRANHQKLKEVHQQMLDYTSVLLANINEAIIGIDLKGKIILYNHKAEMLFGKIELNSVYNEKFNDDLLQLNSTLRTSEVVAYSEIEYQNQSNHNLILAFSTSIVSDNKSKPDLAIAVIRDITEIKLSEEITKRNEKLTATGMLAAGVAHEIRNPMNSIYVIAQRLELEFEPTEEKDEYYMLISTVRREITRINTIISQFLEFSKVRKSIITSNNLSEVIRKSIDLIKPTAINKNIKIINNVADDVFALIDPDKIEQVFINLIHNSIDAIHDNGEIIFELKVLENSVIVSLSDTGVGITEELKSKIFDLYFTTKNTGTGLGLGIVNNIIQEHRGKIYFESTGKGTTFYLELKRQENG